MYLETFVFRFDGSFSNLNSLKIVSNVCEQVAKLAECQIISNLEHRFSPQGISSVYLLAESHLAIHTWPEEGRGYLVLSSCKKVLNDFSNEVRTTLSESFNSTIIELEAV